MTFARTETQAMLGDMLERLLGAENDFETRRHRLMAPEPQRLALWPMFAEQGILGGLFGEEHGGFGGSAGDLAVIMEQAGASLVVEPLLASAVCGRLLAGAGMTAELARIISGEHVPAFAHEEGSDPFAPPSAQVDSSNRLSGRKLAVRHGDLAQLLVVSAQDDQGAGCFRIDPGSPGVTIETFRLIDGSSAANIKFEAVAAERIGDAAALADALAWCQLGLAAEACGIASALNRATFAYLQTRSQFGAPLASFQALRHRAADMHCASEEMHALTARAIESADRGDRAWVALASAAKALADRNGRTISHEAVQMHGGMGVSDELNVSHYMRRLAAIRATAGSLAEQYASLGEMDLAATEADPVRDEVRQFVSTHLPADLAAKGAHGLMIEKDDYVRWQKILHDNGWFAGAWPREFGGAGWGLERQLLFARESALANAPMISPYGVSMVGPVLQRFGSPEQQARYLPDILTSDCWWCQGYSEPNSGSDLASLKTVAVRDGDHYVVNGTKMWTTEAHWADMMHCLVRTDREVRSQAGITFLLIDMRTPGITIQPILTIDGQHHTNQIFFDDVRVPVENRVGEEGQGWTIAKFLLSHERVAIADTGPKLRLLRQLKNRRDALPDGVHRDRVSRRLAEAEVQLTALCALEDEYVRQWSEGAPKDGPQASVLKIRGTEILQLLSEIALEAEGPLGAAHDPADLHLSPLGHFSAAAQASMLAHQYLYGRCWSIFGGTNEVQRNIVARAVIEG